MISSHIFRKYHSGSSFLIVDHPFFGQIFLAGVFAMIGYPEVFTTNIPSTEIDNTIKTLYSVPRILMGLLAVVDTYLVYKIAERRYNKTIHSSEAIYSIGI